MCLALPGATANPSQGRRLSPLRRALQPLLIALGSLLVVTLMAGRALLLARKRDI